MKQRLFGVLDLVDESSLRGETIGAASLSPAPQNSQKAPIGNYVVSTNSIYIVESDIKRVRAWLIGALFNTNDFRKLITTLHILPSDFTVHMFIHSPGGSLSAGCNLLSAMSKCKATIITYNIGTAASCGSLVLSFGDKIHVDPMCNTMFHNAGIGNYNAAHRLFAQTQHLINSTKHLFEMMRSRGIITEEEITGIVKQGKEYYITSDVMTERLKANNLWYEGGV